MPPFYGPASGSTSRCTGRFNVLTVRTFAYSVVTLGLGWSLALAVFFLGIRFLNGRFSSGDLQSFLILTAVAATVQFFVCALLVSVGPGRSRLTRAAFGAAVGVVTAIVPVLVVTLLIGETDVAFVFKGIGAIFLAMFCVSGVVFGLSLGRVDRPSPIR